MQEMSEATYPEVSDSSPDTPKPCDHLQAGQECDGVLLACGGGQEGNFETEAGR